MQGWFSNQNRHDQLNTLDNLHLFSQRLSRTKQTTKVVRQIMKAVQFSNYKLQNSFKFQNQFIVNIGVVVWQQLL